jgi:hypothetical protein
MMGTQAKGEGSILPCRLYFRWLGAVTADTEDNKSDDELHERARRIGNLLRRQGPKLRNISIRQGTARMWFV